jgi:hypothetical protein
VSSFRSMDYPTVHRASDLRKEYPCSISKRILESGGLYSSDTDESKVTCGYCLHEIKQIATGVGVSPWLAITRVVVTQWHVGTVILHNKEWFGATHYRCGEAVTENTKHAVGLSNVTCPQCILVSGNAKDEQKQPCRCPMLTGGGIDHKEGCSRL